MLQAKTTILVVEDEQRIARMIRANLERAGYNVVAAANGAQAIEMVSAEDPDLVLLDIRLPLVDGFDVCKRIREFSQIPIVMLTAKVERQDILRGFEVGADDYIKKPFDPAELVARMKAVLRRHQVNALPEAKTKPLFESGGLRMDFVRHRVTVDGKDVRLSPTEYKLLTCLANNSDKVMMHEDLLQEVWGTEYRDETEYLWVYIRYLRQKIEADPAHPTLILSEPGAGYYLRKLDRTSSSSFTERELTFSPEIGVPTS